MTNRKKLMKAFSHQKKYEKYKEKVERITPEFEYPPYYLPEKDGTTIINNDHTEYMTQNIVEWFKQQDNKEHDSKRNYIDYNERSLLFSELQKEKGKIMIRGIFKKLVFFRNKKNKDVDLKLLLINVEGTRLHNGKTVWKRLCDHLLLNIDEIEDFRGQETKISIGDLMIIRGSRVEYLSKVDLDNNSVNSIKESVGHISILAVGYPLFNENMTLKKLPILDYDHGQDYSIHLKKTRQNKVPYNTVTFGNQIDDNEFKGIKSIRKHQFIDAEEFLKNWKVLNQKQYLLFDENGILKWLSPNKVKKQKQDQIVILAEPMSINEKNLDKVYKRIMKGRR